MTLKSFGKIISIIIISMPLLSQSSNSESEENSIKVYSELNLLSKSIWHGWDISNDQAVYNPYVGVKLWQTGFELGFWASIPIDRTKSFNDDLEFMFRYQDVKNENSRLEMDFHGFINFIHCPNNNTFKYRPTIDNDLQLGIKQLWKLNLGLALNKLIPVGRNYLIPSINMYNFQPAGSADFLPGSVFDISLLYVLPITEKISYSISGTGSYHYRVFGVEDWGCILFVSKIKYKIQDTLFMSLSVDFQNSLNKDVNPEDEIWGGLSFGYSF